MEGKDVSMNSFIFTDYNTAVNIKKSVGQAV